MEKGIMMKRSKNYLDTVYLNDSTAAADIEGWRRAIRDANQYFKEQGINKQYFLRIRGRLGKNSPYAHFYALGGFHYRHINQDVLFQHAERVDLYKGIRPCT